jgi:hypothetical protein
MQAYRERIVHEDIIAGAAAALERAIELGQGG